MEERTCENCQSTKDWTSPAYSEYEVFQIGCWSCYGVYNIVGEEYSLVCHSSEHFIFWKDLKRQWRKVMRKSVSFVKESGT